MTLFVGLALTRVSTSGDIDKPNVVIRIIGLRIEKIAD